MKQNERKWDVDKVRLIIPQHRVQDVLNTPISWTQQRDYLIWPYNKQGTYAVNSGYFVAKEDSTTTSAGPSSRTDSQALLWKHIWGALLPQKIKHFLWSVCHDAIAVRSNLSRRHIIRDATCPICKREDESVIHALLGCEWTRPVWFGSSLQIDPIARQEPSMRS